MRQIRWLILVLFYSCVSDKPSDTKFVWADKEISGDSIFHVFQSRQDTFYFDINYLKQKCKKTDCLDFNSSDTNDLSSMDDSEFQKHFKFKVINTIHTQSDYRNLNMQYRQDDYTLGIDNSNYFNYGYHQYYENDSIFLFTFGMKETAEIHKYILFTLDKETGRLLNVFEDDFQPNIKHNLNWTADNKLNHLMVNESCEEAKDGSWEECWQDSILVQYSFKKNGVITRQLIFAKDIITKDVSN